MKPVRVMDSLGLERDILVLITVRVMPADLIVVCLEYHKVIGMDWLGKNRATLDCHWSWVEFESGCGPLIRFHGLERIRPLWIVTEEGCNLRVGVDPQSGSKVFVRPLDS